MKEIVTDHWNFCINFINQNVEKWIKIDRNYEKNCYTSSKSCKNVIKVGKKFKKLIKNNEKSMIIDWECDNKIGIKWRKLIKNHEKMLKIKWKLTSIGRIIVKNFPKCWKVYNIVPKL